MVNGRKEERVGSESCDPEKNQKICENKYHIEKMKKKEETILVGNSNMKTSNNNIAS